MPVTSKVARHLRASMVGQLGAGLASFCFRLQPQLYKLAGSNQLRRLAIFLNGSLSVFALRRTAKVVRFRASAIVSVQPWLKLISIIAHPCPSITRGGASYPKPLAWPPGGTAYGDAVAVDFAHRGSIGTGKRRGSP